VPPFAWIEGLRWSGQPRPHPGFAYYDCWGDDSRLVIANAQDAVDRLIHHFEGAGPAWTREAPLPGGDLDDRGLAGLADNLTDSAPFLDSRTVRRLAQSYGSRAHRILRAATRLQDLGEDFGAGLMSAEVDCLMAHEWAQTAEDILWRRSNSGGAPNLGYT
jgi:glycerol-3-phosphate dehydrogenase